jgi:hypothetical protein
MRDRLLLPSDLQDPRSIPLDLASADPLARMSFPLAEVSFLTDSSVSVPTPDGSSNTQPSMTLDSVNVAMFRT